MATNKTKEMKLTPLEEEMLSASKKVKEYKIICESNICGLIYKEYELLYSYKLTLEDFTQNMYKVYFQVAHDIVMKEKKILDAITVGLYLEKHPKLAEKFAEYGGYDSIMATGEYVKVENFEGYYTENHKWQAVLRLIKLGFPVYNRISEFVDMSAESIYNEYSALLNDTFIKIETDAKSYSLSYKIDELIDELDNGVAIGMPYSSLPIYSKETGGMYLGGIHLVGGLSNIGKTTFVRSAMIPSALKYNEPIIFILNEDGVSKHQREMIVWVANNVFHEELHKYTVRDGKYTESVRALLVKCANWIKEQDVNETVKFIPLKKWKTSTACKIINKYANLGVKHFCIDTFKSDHDTTSDNNWFIGQQNMVAINDIVKPEAKNLSIVITFQLSKTSSRQRYYTQDNIGVFRNIIDPASTCTMIRAMLQDEMPGEKNELKVFRLEGKNGRTQIPVKIDKNKNYQILFIVKSREGAANAYQIVLEHDLSTNVLKEVGITFVMQDW